MSEIKLLPCPFCKAELKKWDYMPNVFFEHPYNGCILSGKKVLESEHDIKAWNTRKPMERILKRLESKKVLEYVASVKGSKEETLINGYVKGIKKAIDICKEEGGLNE